MDGKIYHEWHGTILTITSDSGTSSMDLQGGKGDTGARGAQGRAGVIIGGDGTIDMTGYATETYVDEKLADISGSETQDLSDYYTKLETHQTIESYLDDYATKEQVDTLIQSALNAIGAAEGGAY